MGFYEACDGTEFCFTVEFEGFVLGAVEVDCEGWDAENWFVEFDEFMGDCV